MTRQPHRPTRKHAADVPDEMPGIVMMLGLVALFGVLAALFIW